MEEQSNKRVLRVELEDEVKQVSITGKDGDEQVVMRQELSEEDLEQATGGENESCDKLCPFKQIDDHSPRLNIPCCYKDIKILVP